MTTRFKTKTFITNGVCFRTKKKMSYENKKHVNLQRRFTYLSPKKLCRRALLDYLHPLMWSSIYPLSCGQFLPHWWGLYLEYSPSLTLYVPYLPTSRHHYTFSQPQLIFQWPSTNNTHGILVSYDRYQSLSVVLKLVYENHLNQLRNGMDGFLTKYVWATTVTPLCFCVLCEIWCYFISILNFNKYKI